MSINKRLEKIREELKLSKTEFAKKVGISQQAYSNYAGGRDIPSSILEKACKILNLDANYILLGKESQTSSRLKMPFSDIKNRITTINNKLERFPLKAIATTIFILEENENITSLEEFLEKIEDSVIAVKYDLKGKDFSKKWDKNTLAQYIEYLLTDDDIWIIFNNKEYYIKYLYFMKKAKNSHV
jgi:transcriptional regulator with XRE-family HTH domain